MILSQSTELCNHQHQAVLGAFCPLERSLGLPRSPDAAPPWGAPHASSCLFPSLPCYLPIFPSLSVSPSLSLSPSLSFSLSLPPRFTFSGHFPSTTEACVCLPCRTGDKCVLHFKPCGLFGKELHKVEGYIQDKR